MTRQKSENRIVPDGRGWPPRRKSAGTRGSRQTERFGGGTAAPVKEVDRQLLLSFATADSPRVSRGATGNDSTGRPAVDAHWVPKARGRQNRAGPATMEEVATWVAVIAPVQLRLPWDTARRMAALS